MNRKTIAEYKSEIEHDVAVFHHVDAGITVLAPAPMNCEVRKHFYDENGSVLICRGIAKVSNPDPVYGLAFQICDQVYNEAPAATPQEFYHEQIEESFEESDYSDE